MADKKISELVNATSINGVDTLPIVQGGQTKKIAWSAILDGLMQGSNNLSEITDASIARSNLGVNSPTTITSEITAAIANHYTTVVEPAINAAITSAIEQSNILRDAAIAKFLDYDKISDILAGIAIFRNFEDNSGFIFDVQPHQNVIIVLDDALVNDTVTNTKTYQIRLPDAPTSAGRWIWVMTPEINSDFNVYVRETSSGFTRFVNDVSLNPWGGLRTDGTELAWSDPASAPSSASVQVSNMAMGFACSFYSDGANWICKKYDQSTVPLNILRI